jgi:branched-chain amino acid transport system substrate-binding protein
MKRTVTALLLGLLSAGPAFAVDDVTIGLMAPLTGPWASEGQEMKRNVEMLAEEQNARGGLNAKKAVIVVEVQKDGSFALQP